MRLVLGKEIAEIDRMAMQDCGISGLWLMENAGRAVAKQAVCLFQMLTLDINAPVVLLAGSGNNGGDALVAARLLAEEGYQTEVFLLASPENYRGNAKTNWERLGRTTVLTRGMTEPGAEEALREALASASLVIDGLFGTGFHGAATGTAALMITAANECKRPILAIDLPSGVNANDGSVEGPAVRATRTVTFGWEKFGIKIDPAKQYAGRVQVADIGLPTELLAKIESDLHSVDKSLVASWLPRRQSNSHKGTYGHVAVVGGAYGMLGAPVLAAGGALKSGAGLVTVASVAEIMVPLACRYPEVMSKLLPASQGVLSEEAEADLLPWVTDKTLAMGMGMGRRRETSELIYTLCCSGARGLVLDADGLYALAARPLDFRRAAFPVVLTPHPKEMARLLGISTAEVQKNRLRAALRAAETFGAVIVLKGANTLTAVGKRVYLNETGNAGMATGGSGDVLSGVIAALLAQGLSAEQAAVLGVYLHGRAGDLAKEELGEYGMSAGDLVRFLPFAFREAAQQSS